jgi:hypothetical protein
MLLGASCRSVAALQEDKRRLEAHVHKLQRSLQVRRASAPPGTP